MKARYNKLIVGFITNLLLVSSVSVFVPIFTKYTDNKSSKNVLLITKNKHNNKKSVNIPTNISLHHLVNNLYNVHKYISEILIQKQETLQHLILGGKVNKNDKDGKNYHISELGWISSNIIHLHRYANQTKATIESSDQNLESEDVVISEIIPLLKNHPYTYATYLNNYNKIIPNIDFFTKSDNSSLLNNLNTNTNNISSNKYNIYRKNTNLNDVSEYSEESTVNMKALSLFGSSIAKAFIQKVSFNAKIITFNKNSNSFQFARTTSINTTNMINIENSSKSNLLYSIKSDNVDSNSQNMYNLLSFNFYRTILSKSTSLFNSSKKNNTTKLPDNFNKHIGVTARSTIQYNNIFQYRHNPLLYTLMITSTLTSILSIISTYVTIKRVKKRILKQRNEYFNNYNEHIPWQNNEYSSNDTDFINSQVREINDNLQFDIINIGKLNNIEYFHEFDTKANEIYIRLEYIKDRVENLYLYNLQEQDETLQRIIDSCIRMKNDIEEIRIKLWTKAINQDKDYDNYIKLFRILINDIGKINDINTIEEVNSFSSAMDKEINELDILINIENIIINKKDILLEKVQLIKQNIKVAKISRINNIKHNVSVQRELEHDDYNGLEDDLVDVITPTQSLEIEQLDSSESEYSDTSSLISLSYSEDEVIQKLSIIKPFSLSSTVLFESTLRGHRKLDTQSIIYEINYLNKRIDNKLISAGSLEDLKREASIIRNLIIRLCNDVSCCKNIDKVIIIKELEALIKNYEYSALYTNKLINQVNTDTGSTSESLSANNELAKTQKRKAWHDSMRNDETKLIKYKKALSDMPEGSLENDLPLEGISTEASRISKKITELKLKLDNPFELKINVSSLFDI